MWGMAIFFRGVNGCESGVRQRRWRTPFADSAKGSRHRRYWSREEKELGKTADAGTLGGGMESGVRLANVADPFLQRTQKGSRHYSQYELAAAEAVSVSHFVGDTVCLLILALRSAVA